MAKHDLRKDYQRSIFQSIADYRASNNDLVDWVVNMAIQIQQIPAPTFDEEKRAQFVLQQFEVLELEQTALDERFNAFGWLKGKEPDLPALMISAHTDTVFDCSVDLAICHEGDRIYGPGLGDNSLGVAGMLGLVKYMRDHNIIPRCNIIFVASTGEEGLGDLQGMRLAFESHKDQVGAVLNLEGLAYGYIYNAGIAVRRFRLEATTGGGHSWAHFGRESAIHGLIELGHRILGIKVPAHPRTTFNIGLIEGGLSINTIAANAQMWLDMRSINAAALAELEEQVRRAIGAVQTENLHISTEIVSERPAGGIADNHPLVELATGVLDAQGTQFHLEASSTDGNIPLSHGCPTVTIGLTVGANAHRVDEYIELGTLGKGIEQLVVLTQLTAQFINQFS